MPANRKTADLSILKLICFISIFNLNRVKTVSVFNYNEILGA